MVWEQLDMVGALGLHMLLQRRLGNRVQLQNAMLHEALFSSGFRIEDFLF
jgi:hypothetical protein